MDREALETITGEMAYRALFGDMPQVMRDRVAAMLWAGAESGWMMSHDPAGRPLPEDLRRVAIRALEYYRAWLYVAIFHKRPDILRAALSLLRDMLRREQKLDALTERLTSALLERQRNGN